MNLSTLFFVFAFLPVSLILYLVCPRVCKNALLVLISFVFYAWGSPVYLLLLLLVTVFNYCVGLDIGNRAESGQRGTKFLLVIGVLFNLLLLGFYKYAAFAIETLNAILPFTLNAPSAALPLGISFFTFQNLSYLSDVYHRRAPAQKNPLDFCLYVSFFPKMISGPIVEYAQFEPQLKSHPVTLYKVSEAVPMLVLGLAKKVLLADNLGGIAVIANLKEGQQTTTFESKTYFFAAVPVGFLAAGFLAVVAFLAGALRVVRLGAGPLARFSASSSKARSGATVAGSSSRRSVAFVSPSVT